MLIISETGNDLKEENFDFDILSRVAKDAKKRNEKKTHKCRRGCKKRRRAKSRNIRNKRKCKCKKGKPKRSSKKEQ